LCIARETAIHVEDIGVTVGKWVWRKENGKGEKVDEKNKKKSKNQFRKNEAKMMCFPQVVLI
jgi:lipocalin